MITWKVKFQKIDEREREKKEREKEKEMQRWLFIDVSSIPSAKCHRSLLIRKSSRSISPCPTRYYFGYTCIHLERFLSFFIPLDRHGGGPRREMDGTKKNIKTNGSCNGMVRTEYGKANIWKYGIDRQSSFFLHRSIFWTTTHFGSVWLVVKRTETLRNLGKGTKSEISL